MIEIKIIEDSMAFGAPRLTTFQLRYPRFIHSEIMTHRVFSRSASSSRAIPVSKIIEAIEDEPAIPSEWGKNQKGMQSREHLDEETSLSAKKEWAIASRLAINQAKALNNLGCHKQIVNRVLEPFSHISVIITATDFNNFFSLRCHPDADPTMQELAYKMREEYNKSQPVKLDRNEMHLPYLSFSDRSLQNAPLISAARCARVSYLTHDGDKCNVNNDLELAKKLLESRHLSPFEHQAVPDLTSYVFTSKSKNFNVGWKQFRYEIEKQGDK